MPSRSVLRALLVLGVAALGRAACAHSGTPRICFSVGALVVTALLARVLGIRPLRTDRGESQTRGSARDAYGGDSLRAEVGAEARAGDAPSAD